MSNGTTITRKQKLEEKPLYGRFKQHLIRENMDMAKKRKPSERNGISPDSTK